MCLAAAARRLARVFRGCVTSDREPAPRRTTPDDDDVVPAVWSTTSATLRCQRLQCVDDPSAPVPVCCCERCDAARFPPPLRMRSCLLAFGDHVTTGNTLSAWSGDVIDLDNLEKSEMSLMSRDFNGVDLLVCASLVSHSRQCCRNDKLPSVSATFDGRADQWVRLPIWGFRLMKEL